MAPGQQQGTMGWKPTQVYPSQIALVVLVYLSVMMMPGARSGSAKHRTLLSSSCDHDHPTSSNVRTAGASLRGAWWTVTGSHFFVWLCSWCAGNEVMDWKQLCLNTVPTPEKQHMLGPTICPVQPLDEKRPRLNGTGHTDGLQQLQLR